MRARWWARLRGRCAWCRREPARVWVPTSASPRWKVGFCSRLCADAYTDDECKQIEADRKQRRHEEVEKPWKEVDRYIPGGG